MPELSSVLFSSEWQYWIKIMLVPSLRTNAFLHTGLIGSDILLYNLLYKNAVRQCKSKFQKEAEMLQSIENQAVIVSLNNYR